MNTNRKFKFLTIARLLYDKGYKELVEVSKRIKNEFPDIEFQWVGDLDKSNPAKIALSELELDIHEGNLVYLGYSSNVKDLISKADCIILPSYHEGLSRTLMEAIAMSKPIITSDIPGCKETVDNGINGFLCNPHDSDSLYEAVKKFINLSEEQIKEMGRQSRLKAERQFDIKDVIKVYENILSSVFPSNP